jgi:hypothetical protein
MRFIYFLGSLLLICGCQDTSKNKQGIDSADKTEIAQEVVSADAEMSEQYSAEGLTRFEKDETETPIESVVTEDPIIPEQAPVQFELKLNPVWAEYGLGMIEVQSTTDQVKIEKIILNRGGCSAIDNSRPLPVTLGFGQIYTGYINNCGLNKIIEIQIHTNLGNWTFKR